MTAVASPSAKDPPLIAFSANQPFPVASEPPLPLPDQALPQALFFRHVEPFSSYLTLAGSESTPRALKALCNDLLKRFKVAMLLEYL